MFLCRIHMSSLPQDPYLFKEWKNDMCDGPFNTTCLDIVINDLFKFLHIKVHHFLDQFIYNSLLDCNCWLFTIMTEKQKEVLKVLNDNQMQSRPFWVPMNQLRMFAGDVYYTKDDRSNHIYHRCLSIPCSTNITDAEMATVVEKIKSVYQ